MVKIFISMTPNEILDLFYSLIDDQPDIDLCFALLDSAYTKRNESRAWEMLKKLDTSITHSPGNTWQTEKTLPTDFGRPYKLFGGDADNEYDPILFEEILRYKNLSNKYAIDLANLKMRLTGSPSSALTMYFWYLYAPTSLVGLTDAQKTAITTIVWPARFRPLLAYDMAEIHLGGVEADEITRQQAPYNKKAHDGLMRAMEAWDNSIKLKMMGGSASPRQKADYRYQSDVVDIG